MKLIRKSHDFRRPLSKRNYTDKVVYHHSAGSDVSAETIHGWHRNNQTKDGKYWAGIGYHFVIRMNGDVEEGRPIDTYGAHAGNKANGSSIGVCLTGNIDINKPTEAQIKSAIWLYNTIIKPRYGDLEQTGHKEFMSTTCPGRYFPLNDIKKGILKQEVIEMASKYFKDIEQKWQATHVDSLKEKGIVSGRTEDTFDPDAPITRAECCVVVNKSVEYLMSKIDSKLK